MANTSGRSNVVADGRLWANYNLDVWESGTNIEGNYSNVSFSFSGAQSGSLSFSGSTRNAAGYLIVNINGADVYNVPIALIRYGQGTASGSGTVRVNHNSDGSMSIGFSIRMVRGGGNYAGDPWTYADSSASGSLTLSNIPRASTPTLANDRVEMGQALEISINRAVSSFKHKVYYTWQNQNKVLIAENVDTTTTWTTPIDLADALPSASSGQGAVVVDTYNGTQLIGSKSVNFTASVPITLRPSLDSIRTTEATAGLAEKFGAFVQSKTAIRVQTNATGQRNATIQSCRVTADGASYDGLDITTAIINGKGQLPIKVEVTDSRGLQNSHTFNVNVLGYTPPTITGFTAYRANSLGQADEDGTNIHIDYGYVIEALGNKNDKRFEIQVKQGEAWTTLKVVDGYASSGTYLTTPDYDAESSYDFRILATDYFTSASASRTVAISFRIMDFGAAGKSMAIGQKSSNGTSLEVGIDAVFNGAVNLNATGFQMSKAVRDVLREFIYPVGSIVEFGVNVIPSEQWGGVWQPYGEGRVLIGSGTGNDGSISMSFAPDSGGGEYRNTGVLKHKHTTWIRPASEEASGYGLQGGAAFYNRVIVTGWGMDSTESGSKDYYNNLPPYKAIYRWVRVS